MVPKINANVSTGRAPVTNVDSYPGTRAPSPAVAEEATYFTGDFLLRGPSRFALIAGEGARAPSGKMRSLLRNP